MSFPDKPICGFLHTIMETSGGRNETGVHAPPVGSELRFHHPGRSVARWWPRGTGSLLPIRRPGPSAGSPRKTRCRAAALIHISVLTVKKPPDDCFHDREGFTTA